MNNFINEIVELSKIPINEISSDFKLIMIGHRVVYVSNFKKIIEYGSSAINIKTKSGVCSVCGSNLSIVQINKGELIIKGEIDCCGDMEMYEKK